jgi:WD40 repeat protein
MSTVKHTVEISAEHPWPGLMPFTEAARAYFNGRDQEAAELQRLIRRERLTVLFGQSGLGKSSLLNAGLFPRLRAEDGLPIYVRLDVSESAPSFRRQVQQAIADNCAEHGVDAPQARSEETLWGFFHQRDTDFWSLKNRLLKPVLVFDQFEEIFTLGHHVESLEQRCREFLEELADLIEDRMPASLAREIEANPLLSDGLDYAKDACKVVFSFREDYLPEFESLRTLIRPIMQNRMRLTRMSGAQAVGAILKSGGHLVRDEVAEQIVRFVSAPRAHRSSDDLERLEVEPALLSVVCRELNNQRLREGRPEITVGQLQDGAQQQIIHDFYEESLADVDIRVRYFVEDQLLTDAGYRDSSALDDALLFPGVTREAIDLLISRRLLRLEERSGVLRVELTHDVLTRVACESRDLRRQEEDERRRREEEATRRQRNRRLAVIGGSVLAAAIGLAVVFGVLLNQANAHREQLETTRSFVSLSRANAALEQGVPGETYAMLADAIRVNPGNEAAVRRAVSLFGQRRHARMLDRGTLATAAEAAWLAPGRYVLFGNQLQVAVRAEASEKLLVRAARDEHADYGLISLVAEAATDISTLRFSDVAPSLRQDEGGTLAYQPDAKVLPYVSRNRMLHLIDPASRKTVGNPVQLTGVPQAVGVSPDRSWVAVLLPGSQLLLAATDGKYRSMTTLAALGKAHESPIAFVTNFGGALVRGNDSAEYVLADRSTHAPLTRLLPGAVEVARAAPGAAVFAVAIQKEVRLHDALTGAPLGDLLGHPSTVRDLAFSADGRLLATACLDKLARTWEVDKHSLAGPTLKHHGAVLSVRFGEDGSTLYTGSADGAARLWNPLRGELLVEPMVHPDPVAEVLPEPGGEHLLVLTNGQEFYRWQLRHSEQPRAVSAALANASVIAVSPDSGVVAWGNAAGEVLVEHPEGKEGSMTLGAGGAPVLTLQFSADGARIAVARSNGEVSVHVLATGALVAPAMKHPNAVHLLRFSHDGRWLATASQDRSVRVWDVARGEALGLRVLHRRTVQKIAFSPDDRLLLSADRERLELWDFVSATPRGEMHANAERGGAIRLVDADFVDAGAAVFMLTGDGLQRMELGMGEGGMRELGKTPVKKSLPLRDFKPWAAALSPDRQRLAVGSLDGRLRMVDMGRLAFTGEVMRHEDAIVGMSYGMGGRSLLSWSRDRSLRLWDAASGYAVADAVSFDGDVLTAGVARSRLGVIVAGKGGSVLPLGEMPAGKLPDWLPELLELLGGTKIDSAGTAIRIPDRLAALHGFAARPLDASSAAWQQWARQVILQTSTPVTASGKEKGK